MKASPVRSIVVVACVAAWSLLVATGASAGGQNAGPAPIAAAVDSGVAPQPFHPSTHGPAAAPNHPPIALVPPKPMPFNPDWSAPRSASGPGQGVMYDALTGQQTLAPLTFAAPAAGLTRGGGNPGADGGVGNESFPATMGGMSLVGNPLRASFPYRMNVKLLMRWGSNYFVCSGSMRDANVVLTAGHCVYDTSLNAWADEVWVYPAWDGNASLFGPDIEQWYGWAHSTTLGSWTGWTVSHDFNYDIGAVGMDRAAGFLTGWFGWAYGFDCAFATTTTYNSASYPAEACGLPGLHNGADMYIWPGSFDSCPNTNRLGLNTPIGGCFGAVWGGMSGSGAYFFDTNGNRFTHAITSTSNRSTYAEYTRQWQDWVNFLNGTFDPVDVQGSSFNLQPLNMTGPASFIAGQSTGGLHHLAANTSTASLNTTYNFGVYLSNNDLVTPADTLISSQFFGWNFGPVSDVTINMAAVTIPGNTPPGNYYLGVIYDPATDGNPSDNATIRWDALPITVHSVDLVMSALSAPAKASPASTFDVSNTVHNNGDAATATFRVGLHLSVGSVCTAGDTLIGSRTLSLGPGGSDAASTPVTIPSGTALGSYFICAFVDDLDQIPEYNKSNNERSVAIDILSAVPTITLKVNGMHPTPPVVATTGPYDLTITVAPTTMTAALDAYWALIVNGSLLWVTSSGISTVPAPLFHGPAPVWTDLSLINVTLPHGVTLATAFLFVNGSTVVSSDFIIAQTPALATATH